MLLKRSFYIWIRAQNLTLLHCWDWQKVSERGGARFPNHIRKNRFNFIKIFNQPEKFERWNQHQQNDPYPLDPYHCASSSSSKNSLSSNEISLSQTEIVRVVKPLRTNWTQKEQKKIAHLFTISEGDSNYCCVVLKLADSASSRFTQYLQTDSASSN